MGDHARIDLVNYSHPGPAEPALRRARVTENLGGLRLDQALARMFPEFSRNRLQAWIDAGRVRVDGAMAKPRRKVWGGEEVELAPGVDPSTLADRPEAIAIDVIYEDESLLVIDKAAGQVVHPASGNWQGTLLNALLHRVPSLAGMPRAGIVHRLDKDTSGLLVVARTIEAHTNLVRQLQARTVSRHYLAIASGRVARDGTVQAPVGRDPRVRTRMAVVPGGKPAVTHYRVVQRFKGATLLECRLETGRTHQIRVHLASIGHPLLGDPVYRTPAAARAVDPALRFPRQALHAALLAFDHPRTGVRRQFDSPPPADIAALIEALK